MKKQSSKLLFLLIGFFLATTVSYLNAWTGPQPGTNPPDNNVAAPINVGNSSQSKNGVLGLEGLSVFGNAQISTTTYTLPVSLSLGVNGKIGAKQYCDENGTNCDTPSLSQVVYLKTKISLYPIIKSVFTTGANTVTTSWTRAELDANSSEFANEKRKISALIIDYVSTFSGGSANVDYYVGVNGLSGNGYAHTTNMHLVNNALYVNGADYGQVFAHSIGGNDTYTVVAGTSNASNASVTPAGMITNFGYTIVGYITY